MYYRFYLFYPTDVLSTLMFVPHAAIAVETYVYAVRFQIGHKRYEFTGLHGGFASREGNPSPLAEKRLLAHGHVKDFGRRGRFAAPGVDCVRIGTIKTLERAPL